MAIVRGEAATIYWGHYVAASLGSWTLTAGSLVATVREVDTFRVSQSPLTLVIRQDRCHLTGLQMTGATLTASIASMETPHAGLVRSS